MKLNFQIITINWNGKGIVLYFIIILKISTTTISIPNKQNVTMLFYHLLFHYLVVLDLPKLQLKQKFQSFQFLPKTSEKLFEP